MDIANQLQSIVNQLVDEIKTKLDADIRASIDSQIIETLNEYDFDSVVDNAAKKKLDAKLADFKVDTSDIEIKLGQLGSDTITNIKAQVLDVIQTHVANYDLEPLVEQTLKSFIKKVKFPEESINSSAIDFSDLTLSGDHIEGGIIKQFASTGIDDKATQCQITIFDTHVVVEKPILTSGIQVEGNIKVENAINVGTINALQFNEDSQGFVQLEKTIRDRTLNEIKTVGVVAPKLVWNDKEIINSSEISSTVLTSSLRKVGTLEDLQTRGETLLDRTLYVSNKRVGINTLEPEYALTVWDGEIEVAINKVSQTRAYIGTHRPISVTLGANGNENISLDIDGSVTINNLRLGALPISTASSQPNWSGIAGEIIFNDSPKIGVPIGWVCLEGHRWANFGTIQE